MMIEEINDLPEKLSSDKLRIIFLRVIKCNEEVVVKFECINELAEKQWHNYELIDIDLRDVIIEWMQRNLDFDSPTMVDYSLNIISYLGLQQVYEWLKKCKMKNDEAQRLVEEAIKEYGEDVSNPYTGM